MFFARRVTGSVRSRSNTTDPTNIAKTALHNHRSVAVAKPKLQVMELCVDMTHASHPSNPPSHVRFVLQLLFAKFSLQVLLLAGDDVVLYACNNSGQQN